MNKTKSLMLMLLITLFIAPLSVLADESIGVIKTLSGQATIYRNDSQLIAKLGDDVFAIDKIETADDSTIGLLLHDDARLSLGPNSTISLDQFNFDKKSQAGTADISIKEGTLSVIAGKMVETTPGSFKVKTPAAILAVRGTEFSVKVDPSNE